MSPQCLTARAGEFRTETLLVFLHKQIYTDKANSKYIFGSLPSFVDQPFSGIDQLVLLLHFVERGSFIHRHVPLIEATNINPSNWVRFLLRSFNLYHISLLSFLVVVSCSWFQQ